VKEEREEVGERGQSAHEEGNMPDQQGKWQVRGGEGQMPGHPQEPQGQQGGQAGTAQGW